LARAYPRLLKADYPPSALVLALPLISRAQPQLVTCGTYYLVQDGDDLLGAGGWTANPPGGRTNDAGLVISATWSQTIARCAAGSDAP
jgi:hypothetical protein